jgi:hypothetical protein
MKSEIATARNSQEMQRQSEAMARCATLPVNLKGLKQFAVEKLPKEWPLRDVLAAEEDEIPAYEFLAKTKVWLTLLRYKRD